MRFLSSAFSALPEVASSPLAFVAYLAVVGAWLVIALKVRRNRQLLAHLRELPAGDRLAALKAEMGSLPVPRELSAEQYLRARIHSYYFRGFLAACLTVVVILVVGFAAGSGRGGGGAPRPNLEVVLLPEYTSTPEYDDMALDQGRLAYIRWRSFYRFINNSAADLLVADVAVRVDNMPGVRVRSQPRPHVVARPDLDSLLDAEKRERGAPAATAYPIHLPPHSSRFLAVTARLTAEREGEAIFHPREALAGANEEIAYYFGLAEDEKSSREVSYELAVTTLGERQTATEHRYPMRSLVLFIGKLNERGEQRVYQTSDDVLKRYRRMEEWVQTAIYSGRSRSGDHLTALDRQTEDELRKYVVDNPGDVNGFLELSTRLYTAGEWDESERVLAAYRTDDDLERAMVLNNLAAVEFDRKEFAEGLAHLDQAVALAPCEAVPYHNLLEYEIYRGDREGGAAVARRRLDNCDEQYGFWAERLYVRTPNRVQDLDYFLRAVELEPTNGELWVYAGSTLHEAGRGEKAIEYLERALALELTPLYRQKTQNNVCAALLGLERLEEAAECSLETIERDPDYFFGHYNLAYVYFLQKRYREAAAAYRRALEIEPGSALAHRELAAVYQALGDRTGARRHLERAREAAGSET